MTHALLTACLASVYSPTSDSVSCEALVAGATDPVLEATLRDHQLHHLADRVAAQGDRVAVNLFLEPDIWSWLDVEGAPSTAPAHLWVVRRPLPGESNLSSGVLDAAETAALGVDADTVWTVLTDDGRVVEVDRVEHVVVNLGGACEVQLGLAARLQVSEAVRRRALVATPGPAPAAWTAPSIGLLEPVQARGATLAYLAEAVPRARDIRLSLVPSPRGQLVHAAWIEDGEPWSATLEVLPGEVRLLAPGDAASGMSIRAVRDVDGDGVDEVFSAGVSGEDVRVEVTGSATGIDYLSEVRGCGCSC